MPVFVALSDLEYFYSLLDGMLVHRRVTPQNQIRRLRPGRRPGELAEAHGYLIS